MPKLTVKTVASIKTPGRYADGCQKGLYLRVRSNGHKSWTYRFMKDGKAAEIAVGVVGDMSLEDARGKVADLRRSDDPKGIVAPAKIVTFREAAEAFIEGKRDGWRNEKHAAQWAATLVTYAYPVIGDKPVADVDVEDMLAILSPIWATKTETASRVRGRIENVLDAAKVKGLRTGENPARWKGGLQHLLQARGKVQKVNHHPALPHDRVPAFMADLRAREAIAARALELAILCASRTSEVLLARWEEFDLAKKLWLIPGSRTKTGVDYREALSDGAITVIQVMAAARLDNCPWVFPGYREGRPLSNMALLKLLERMNLRNEAVTHGFRSSFRDWATECTSYPWELVEMALGHKVGTKVERAYMRTDLFERRLELMNKWADYCNGYSSVVQLRA